MRAALIVAVAVVAFAPQLPGAAQSPAPQSGPKVQIKFEPGGLVTLETRDATIREVLAEWSRLGGSTFVNGDRLSGAPVSLQFISQPEKEVMASLLRQAAGYVLGPRRAGTIGASSFEVVYILPTSNPSAGGYTPAPQVTYQPQIITPGNPDDEIPPAGRGTPPPPSPSPGQPPGPQPGPEYRPATSTGSGVAVPVIAVPPVTSGPPASPPPPNTGRAGSPPGTAGS